MSKANKLSSNGGKTVTCVRCSGDIPPYAGVAANTHSTRFVHHPGQCADTAERESAIRAKAQANGFAWSCRQLELGQWDAAPEICGAAGTDRASYEQHMKAHGKHAVSAAPKIRLRKNAPAAKLPALEVPPFKFLTWTERHYTTRYAGDGSYAGQDVTEAERRGQLWSPGPYPHSVWVLPFEPAPWEVGRPAPVALHIIEPGRYSADWSEAKRERREVTLRAGYRKAA